MIALTKRYLLSSVNSLLGRWGYQLARCGLVAPVTPENLEWLRQYKISTFIDIGANVGEYVDFAVRYFPGAKIYAFEPLEDCFDTLSKKHNFVPGLEVFNYALGDEEAIRQIHRSSYAPASSLLGMCDLTKQAFPEAANHETTLVEVKCLDNVLAARSLEPEIFVKIDTQGYEDRVIRGGRQVLSRASIIQIEVSFEMLYEGQVLFSAVYHQLSELGFVFHGVKNQVRAPQDGRVLQAHAFFTKEECVLSPRAADQRTFATRDKNHASTTDTPDGPYPRQLGEATPSRGVQEGPPLCGR
jgi:FkbM family methyltransferase